MNKNILKYLVCVNCSNDLRLKVLKHYKNNVIEGVLYCNNGHEFPIIKSIPRILKKEFMFKIYKNNKHFFNKYNINVDYSNSYKKNIKEKIAESFTYEWKKYNKLYDFYEWQFLDWINPVKKDFFKNKLVLDAGCGNGRHTFFAAKYSSEVIAIDLGESIEVAQDNNKNFNNVNFIQSDIYNLPFKNNIFDYAYCIGVLHHLPRPYEGFLNLIKYIKKNGRMSIWVYGNQSFIIIIFNILRINLFSKISIRLNHFISNIITISLYPIIYYYKLINQYTSNRFKYILPQFDFLVYLSKLNYKVIRSITFDQMLAPVAFYYKREDIYAWFKRARLKNILITERNDNSWRGTGIK